MHPTDNTYDAIIIGARVAGSPTAMLLARQGYRVLAVDKATFPSDTMSTHMIQQHGVARLKRWGLLDAIVEAGTPPARNATFDFGEFTLSGRTHDYRGADAIYNPRRTVLDKILVDAARDAGAEVREGFSVKELIVEDGVVRGIRGRNADGTFAEERARIVIGADGKHSVVARTVGAQSYNEKPAASFCYYAYYSGLGIDAISVHDRPDRIVVVFPTNDGQTLIGMQGAIRDFHDFRSDIEGNFQRTLDLVPEVAERVASGRRESRLLGTADFDNFFRVPYGPGWALVGDAGYHRDAMLGQGISDAFRDAELLAGALGDAFSGDRPIEDALADYQQQRDEAVLPMYELVTEMATLAPPPPESAQLMFAMQGNQRQIDRFIATISGAIPVQEFFSEENVAAIMHEAAERAEADRTPAIAAM
jgi:flavin-dependent dehydrogenase